VLVNFPILTLIVFLPAIGALLAYLSGSDRAARAVALLFSVVVLGLATVLLAGFLWPSTVSLPSTPPGPHVYFAVEKSPWVPTLGVNYFLGVDELSIVLVFLNALLTPLALAIGWDEHHRVPEFFAMFLFMEATINGVFLSLDLFQFFVFWEVGLIPMYFLIAVWGGPRKKYAAMKFFLYTFLASLPLLVAIFAFYFYSSPHTFDMTAIIAGTPIPPGAIGDLMFVALLVAFGTKLPTWPLHTWLPDAHVEAPTGGSVILAGILLKLGGYGLIRFNVQMVPEAAKNMYWLLGLVGVISILYGAVVCLAQDDLKRLVAFSSVSHMGFVTLGIAAGVYGFTQAGNGRGAVIGFAGAIFQMFAHGLISAALFMVAGSLGHKLGTRNISELGGIAKRAPRMATFIMISFMASLGLPGLVGFVAEFSVFLGVYAAFGTLVFVPILTVIVTAAYYIWAMQKAIFGPLNPKWESMPDLHRFEVAPLAVLVAAFAVFGIAPLIFFDFLSTWSRGILGGL
jgi:NADH-quinone oxidoreductase subunit M